MSSAAFLKSRYFQWFHSLIRSDLVPVWREGVLCGLRNVAFRKGVFCGMKIVVELCQLNKCTILHSARPPIHHAHKRRCVLQKIVANFYHCFGRPTLP